MYKVWWLVSLKIIKCSDLEKAKIDLKDFGFFVEFGKFSQNMLKYPEVGIFLCFVALGLKK